MRSIFLKWTVIFFENKYFECWAVIMSVSFPNCKGRKSPPEKQEMHCLSLARIIVQSLPTRGVWFLICFLISSLCNDSYKPFVMILMNFRKGLCRSWESFPSRGRSWGGRGGGHLPSHVLGIYLVNFGNFWKFIFRYLLSPPHKKFASAHPGLG